MHTTDISSIFLRALGNAIALVRRRDPRLVVVNYHRVLARPDPMLDSEPDVAAFRWQMELLARSFNVLPLHEALQLLDAGRLPPRAVCITFDDGYRSIHDLALPILKEYGLPATIFVTSGYLGDRNMWNDRIIEAVQTLPAGQLDLSELGLGAYSLSSLDDRKSTLGRLTEESKYLIPAARNGLIARLEALVGDALAHGLMLTPDMVVNLDREGIEIGAHTVTHPILTSLDDGSAKTEIIGSKEELETLLGKPVRLFAYPNGKVGMDFNDTHVAMVRASGYAAAFTTAIGPVTRTMDRYQLPRSRPWDRNPFLFGLRLLRWLAQDSR
jgi:peptidoglycan/xylan/chitin deacetylase (PgdA/CDA1 family)